MRHDQNFKNLILDYLRQALAFFAPDEAADGLPGAKILPVRQEQLKERLKDRFRGNDRIRYAREYPHEAKMMATFFRTIHSQQGEQQGARKGEADAETLLQWSAHVLTANSHDEVIAPER